MIATVAVLDAVLKYGPTVLPLIQQLTGMIRDKKVEVTPEDIAQLIALGSRPSGDYLAAVGGAPATATTKTNP